ARRGIRAAQHVHGVPAAGGAGLGGIVAAARGGGGCAACWCLGSGGRWRRGVRHRVRGGRRCAACALPRGPGAGGAGAAAGVVARGCGWVRTGGEGLCGSALGHLMAPHFAAGPAAAFYVLYIGGMVGFALAPALAGGRARIALGRGAALGLLAYATYDLTNQA